MLLLFTVENLWQAVVKTELRDQQAGKSLTEVQDEHFFVSAAVEQRALTDSGNTSQNHLVQGFQNSVG